MERTVLFAVQVHRGADVRNTYRTFHLDCLIPTKPAETEIERRLLVL